MTKTTERPGITKATVRFEGREIDVTHVLGKYIRVEGRDVAILNTAGELAKKAGDAAAKACQRAELTAEESAALSLAGYAEEALVFLQKRTFDGVVEWTTFHQDAIRTGLRLYYAECTKVREKQTTLLIGTDETDEQAQEINRVLVHVLRAPGAQLDALDTDED